MVQAGALQLGLSRFENLGKNIIFFSLTYVGTGNQHGVFGKRMIHLKKLQKKSLMFWISLVLKKRMSSECHLVQLSLRRWQMNYPDRVKSLILGGAIIRFDIRTKFLMLVARMTKKIVPYMLLYKIFAYILMPRKSHEESRLAFVNQAKLMSQKEFVKWFSLTKLINPYLDRLQISTTAIPTLFLMGEQDYLFTPPIKEVVRRNNDFEFIAIKDSGHVCNIDQPESFQPLIHRIYSENRNEKSRPPSGVTAFFLLDKYL